jgi:hypothetical protein
MCLGPAPCDHARNAECARKEESYGEGTRRCAPPPRLRSSLLDAREGNRYEHDSKEGSEKVRPRTTLRLWLVVGTALLIAVLLAGVAVAQTTSTSFRMVRSSNAGAADCPQEPTAR